MKAQVKSSIRYALNKLDSPVIILIYHRVTNLTDEPQQLSVSPKNFAEQIEHLKKEYYIVEVDEFKEAISKRRALPQKSVLLTFDDGYADNLHEALPILEHNKAQAIFFISTSLLNTSIEFWWDDLERILLRQPQIPNRLNIVINNHAYAFDTKNQSQRNLVYNTLHPLLKNCKTAARDRVINDLLQWVSLTRDGRESHRVLRHDELVTFSKSHSVVIGAHTHTHPKLSCLSYEEQYFEISESKKILEELLGNSIIHFSYPFGSMEDFSSQTIEICKDLGFEMVCANYYNQVHRWSNKYKLPRMLVRNWDGKEFETQMNSFFKH